MIIQIDVTDGRILSWNMLEGSYDLENDANIVEILDLGSVNETNFSEYCWSEGGVLTHVPPVVHTGVNMAELIIHHEFLSQTDWYVIRNFETGAAIPQDILDARAAARAAIVAPE
jgi:hypothetical protein